MSVFHRNRSSRKTGDCAAIFVHAGAGYHSIQNEAVHLQACNDAATAAMALLRNGATAVEAAEIAIKVLEDREITNAGYGSNLAIDGVVEGDAVVVDHLGRSGGVGAVAQIKNPISLARTVLDLSTQELTLRRVPPNLLVGQGATDFAYDHGLPVLPHDALVSPAAKERWLRWKQDLKNAEKKARQQQNQSGGSSQTTGGTPVPSDPPPEYEEQVKSSIRREHQKALKASVWNEGQPVSPPSSATGVRPASGISTGSRASSIDSRMTPNTPETPEYDVEELQPSTATPLTAENLARNTHARHQLSPLTTLRRPVDAHDAAGDFEESVGASEPANVETTMSDVEVEGDMIRYRKDSLHLAQSTWHDGHSTSDEDSSSLGTLRLPSITPSPPELPESRIPPTIQPSPRAEAIKTSWSTMFPVEDSSSSTLLRGNDYDTLRQDCITDTVGAIAIDSEGNIACGASSGGIGMKYRGRIGPAALVGVGAAVVPVDPEDKSKTCTGAVTSGTGEHMGTTLAASVCAERLYHGQKKRKGGGYEHCEDDQAVRAMIENDFMDHPSVKYSHSTGAIGVLAVKKTAQGAYLYFAHNTDSFALASMHADEPKPTSTMSRSHGNGMVAQGGRAIRYKRKW